jgi:3-deoxy-7-phosphoheptulonate synthase
MLIKVDKQISNQHYTQLLEHIAAKKYKVSEVRTQSAHYLICIGKNEIDLRSIGHLPGIADIFHVSDEYKLVSAKWKTNQTIINLGNGVTIGGGNLSIIAGPCSIETEDQVENTLNHLVENDVHIMRGGVFKPRSSPYAFRGLGIDGLKMWHQLTKDRGIKIITEVMQVSQIEEMYDYVDVFQVGARNSQNFNLLDELGKVDKPVMIKRGISGTIDELLYAAEYVFSAGNEKIILCERGIRTYERASRNTFDVNAIPLLKSKTHLPVVADPSHGIGIRDFVEPIALAAVMAGADGIIYETHEVPEKAASDGQQTLNFMESAALIHKLKMTSSLKLSFV